MELDYQAMFNISFIGLSFFGGWIFNRVFVLLDNLENDIKLIPEKYVAKADYREDIREIKELLMNISKRMENKEDKKWMGS